MIKAESQIKLKNLFSFHYFSFNTDFDIQYKYCKRDISILFISSKRISERHSN